MLKYRVKRIRVLLPMKYITMKSSRGPTTHEIYHWKVQEKQVQIHIQHCLTFTLDEAQGPAQKLTPPTPPTSHKILNLIKTLVSFISEVGTLLRGFIWVGNKKEVVNAFIYS